MAVGTNGGGNGAPATNGQAYKIEDHTYDVVVVGAGGAGLRAVVGCGEAGQKHSLALPCLATHPLAVRV